MNSARLDFTVWDQMLKRYVDQQGRVNYSTWKQNDQIQLSEWLNTISQTDLSVDLSTLTDRNQQLAFWLNLYNALVIQQVLCIYPISSIQPQFLGIPNWFAFFWFFWKPLYQIGDRRYSLNQIEHKILRPQFQDPRIHFSLVCAAIGCPLLRREAYIPESVQVQLENDAKRFIQNPEKVRYDAQTQTLYCSKIFQWYRQDFLNISPSILDYIQLYMPSLNLPNSASIRYSEYDWNLNQRISS
jgi:hypothetical protein